MIVRLGIATWLLVQATVAFASLPSMTGDVSRPECIDAEKLARDVFQSTARRLYDPLKLPAGLQSTLLFGAPRLESSGGDVRKSTVGFEEIPQDNPRVYWAKETNGALRVVVRADPVGWRGDQYYLYLLEADVTKDDFLNSFDSDSQRSIYQSVVSDSWNPPLVFQHAQNKTKWFIDVGQPYQILSDWRVFSSKDRSAICTITFSPPGKEAVARLPLPVTKLARKLDATLGPGLDEGTSQPTARLRGNAQHVLANAALRPWALVDHDACDSRSVVDAGLKDWSKITGSHRRLYGEILKEYPAAERSLATYYTRVFGLQPAKAQEVAAWVTDLVFRSFFSFPSAQGCLRDDLASTNPWPPKH